MSYLDRRPGPSEEFQAEIAAKREAKQLTPEQQEARDARQARVEAALSEAALVQSGDPEALKRDKARQEEHDRRWEERQASSEDEYRDPDMYVE